MHETWLKAYEEGKSSLVALFDLSAAFDTLSKDISALSSLPMALMRCQSHGLNHTYQEEVKL